MIEHSPDIKERFEAKAIPEPNGGCWLWTGSLHHLGYGQITVANKLHKTHRFAWRLYRGAIPDGAHVLHRCDVRCCVNPDHLFLGTHAENMKDMALKGRGRTSDKRGEKSGTSRLTDEKVRTARAMRVTGFRQHEIAKLLDVSVMTINRLLNGKAWNHVHD